MGAATFVGRCLQDSAPEDLCQTRRVVRLGNLGRSADRVD